MRTTANNILADKRHVYEHSCQEHIVISATLTANVFL